MLLTFITFVTALTISAVAIYYSVAGLAAIFAAAVIPIVIMGGILEIAKLVTTVWLHRYWQQARWWLKTYLTVAVVVLMFITSMGIFGFLSKAHIEQTTAGQESAAQSQQMAQEIERQSEIIRSAEDRIKQITTQGVGGDANIQAQIQQEQYRIDSAYSRVQPAIDEQQRIIDGQTKIYSDSIAKIDEQLQLLQRYIDNKEVDKAQSLVGVKSDGDWGPATARAVTAWKSSRERERVTAVAKLEESNNNATIKSARDEILRIRKTVETQITESNRLVNRLRDQLGKSDSQEVERLLTEQRDRIRTAQTTMDDLTKKKYQIESEYRKLEAEVGPIKYIATMIYGEDPDTNTLEKAVSWLIIVIIFVFDPLAVLLLLASQYSYEYHLTQRRKKPETEPDDSPVSDHQIDQPRPIVATPVIEPDQSEPVQESTRSQESKSIPLDNHGSQVNVDTQPEPFIESVPEETLDRGNYNHDKVTVNYTEPSETKTVDSDTVPTEHADEEKISEISQSTLDDTEVTADAAVTDDSTKSSNDTIVTSGVTEKADLFHPKEQYVIYEGKQYNINALKSIKPELILPATDPENQILFGQDFPKFARIGDISIRTDVMPNRVFKFNGKKWMEVDKNLNTSYLQYTPYINYLIEKLDSGEYDAGLLTDYEQEEITNQLKSK